MRSMKIIQLRVLLFSLVMVGGPVVSQLSWAQTKADQEFDDRVAQVIEDRLKQAESVQDAHYQRTLTQRLLPYYEDPSRGTAKDVFHTFSQAYIGGSRYDPFGTETIATLESLAEAASAVEKEEFRSLLEWHLPNYTVLEAAIPLVRDKPDLGDIKLLEWMHSQIIDRLSRLPADSMGSTTDVASIGEADFILAHRASRVIDTEVHVAPGDTCYLIHTVEPLQPGGPEKIYLLYSSIARHVVNNYAIPTQPLGIFYGYRAATPYCVHPFVAPDVAKR